MGTKRKNSNYVTEKTLKAREEALLKEKADRNWQIAKYVIIGAVIVALIVAVILIINALFPSFKVTHRLP